MDLIYNRRFTIKYNYDCVSFITPLFGHNMLTSLKVNHNWGNRRFPGNCLSYKRISNVDMSKVVEIVTTKPLWVFQDYYAIILIAKSKMQLFSTFWTIIKFIYFEGIAHRKISDCMLLSTKISNAKINNGIRIKNLLPF